MALTVYTCKDNQWREFLNPLRGLTLERIVQLIEQGERGSFADLQRNRQIVLLGTGGLLTMLSESGSGTLAGSAHSEAFRQVAQADAVLVSESFQRDLDATLLEAAFPGWPVETGFEMTMEDANPYAELMTPTQ